MSKGSLSTFRVVEATSDRRRPKARDRRARGGGGRRGEDQGLARKPPIPTALLAHLMGQLLETRPQNPIYLEDAEPDPWPKGSFRDAKL